jgi:hypothetical protein
LLFVAKVFSFLEKQNLLNGELCTRCAKHSKPRQDYKADTNTLPEAINSAMIYHNKQIN